MFTKSEIEIKLDSEILALLDKLESTQKDSEDYATLVDRLSKLHKLKAEEKPRQISPDTLLTASVYVFGVLWVTRYEKERVLSTKALGFIPKPK